MPLGGGGIAGLFHDVPAHGMTSRVRGLAADAGKPAGLVPDGVDRLRRQPALAVDDGRGRQKERRPGMGFSIPAALAGQVVLNRLQALRPFLLIA